MHRSTVAHHASRSLGDDSTKDSELSNYASSQYSSDDHSLVEHLCRSRLFELFPELPGKEVEDAYMRCGGVLQTTYQLLLERMASMAVKPLTFSKSRCTTTSSFINGSSGHLSSSSGSVDCNDLADGGTISKRNVVMPARATTMLSELEAERRRTEEATRAIEAEAELATEQLLQHESTIVAAESARETAERAAQADRVQCEEVMQQLSNVRERIKQLDADFEERIQDAIAAEQRREATAAAAVAAEAAANAATAASLKDQVARLEASIASTDEALESTTAQSMAVKAEQVRAREEEAELRKAIENLKLQQERDEHDRSKQQEALVHEQKKREELEQETSELDRQRGKIDGELDQLAIQHVSSQSHKGGKSAAEVGGTSTDPDGIQALVGEDMASYIKRQQRLQQEAKDRMAAKFGGVGVGHGQRQRLESISSSGSSVAELATISPTAETVPAPGSSQNVIVSPASSGRNSPTLPPASGWLHVTIIACNNILAADHSGRSDSYIKLRLGSEERSTKVCEKKLNPVFNETLVLPVDVVQDDREPLVAAQLSSDTFLLHVEVWNKDRHGRDEFLGECSVHLLDLFAGVWTSAEHHVHCPFEDPQRRLSARERKQAKRRGGSQPCGTVDLQCSFETKAPMPSLAEWLAEKDLAVYTQRVAEAMKNAEVPDDEAVPMLAGMDSRELGEFIDACAQAGVDAQHEITSSVPDAAGSPSVREHAPTTWADGEQAPLSSAPLAYGAAESEQTADAVIASEPSDFIDDDASDFADDDDFGA